MLLPSSPPGGAGVAADSGSRVEAAADSGSRAEAITSRPSASVCVSL